MVRNARREKGVRHNVKAGVHGWTGSPRGVLLRLLSEDPEAGKILGWGIIERENQQPVGWALRQCGGGQGGWSRESSGEGGEERDRWQRPDRAGPEH